ncbi:MAG TPA: hypothetical protein VHE81_15325 [Lacipirellulaceae bacterium]|nr:hypothetical protein [Lacipirellulaceae bacterium]
MAERNAPAEIVATAATKAPVASAAIQRLTDYIKALTGSPPRIRNTLGKTGTAIVIGDAALADKYNVTPPDDSRDESFVISPLQRDGRTVLIVSGRTDKGIKQAINFVLRHLFRSADGKVLLDPASFRAAPFIKLRVSHIGGYTRQAFDRTTGKRLPKGVHATPEQLDWNYISRWDPRRLGDYIDMLDFFGYNGIEEPPNLYAPAENDDSTAVARRRIVREHVERNGMISIAKIDGTLAGGGSGAVPYGADSKERYEQYYREMAESAAPYNDYVLTHWVDAGGWKSTPQHPCNLDVLQELHMQIDRQFKRVNPRIESLLSLWYLDHPMYQRWLGYRGVETILNSGKLPREVGLAMSRTYRPEEAEKITAAGRRAAVWGWYMADHELLYTMHVHTHAMATYFHNLPPDAGDKLFAHILDNCQRETNLYTVYVGAQMMWNPKGDPESYLREAARLVYGPKLEDPVFRGLKAIADVRCGPGPCRGCWTPGRTRVMTDAAKPPGSNDGATEASNGIVTFEQGYRQALEADEGLKKLKIDKNYVPPIRFHRPTDVLLAELKRHVHAVAAYMQFVRDKKEGKVHPTEVPSAPGPFEYYERLRYLQAQ